MSEGADEAAVAQVFRYHDRTKHDFRRSAPAPGYMDWANQPDPFRRYAGAPLFQFPFNDSEPETKYEDLYSAPVTPQPLNVQTIGWFFEWSLGVSATKSAGGSTWKLRCNPSSGNLHPTEGYAMLPAIAQLSEPGVYHYRADKHGLEQRSVLTPDAWERISASFPIGTFFAALSSIHWREAWKYGERAFRYCNHDAGHALAALRYSAAALGWRCALLEELGDGDIAALLGADQTGSNNAESEHPDLIAAVMTNPTVVSVPTTFSTDAIASAQTGQWQGVANVLSNERVDWPIIEQTAAACFKPQTEPLSAATPLEIHTLSTSRNTDIAAGRIFRQRRSAVDMDGASGISRASFYTMLERTMPRTHRPPFDVWPYPSLIHLGLFVHRVDDFAPGLYGLVRNAEHIDELQSEMRSDFDWSTPPHCPANLPLFHLATGDGRGLAAQLSCMQDIAGSGAFSLGMIARFEAPLREYGAWFYRRLFWESGIVGQTLYLEAEAAGLRGTGIGCYFDDPVHRVFGLRGHAFQSLYHFTVGGPVDDPRLTNLPPYAPERRAQSGWV